MKVKTLSMHNFMPYKGTQEISFPQHETQNVMLIFGDNMRGKTSILNAIRWGFYGKALGRHLREIPWLNLVNSEAASDGDWSVAVTLCFDHDGKDYELTRRVEKRDNTSHPRNNADFKEDIGLRIDGVPVTGDMQTYEISQIMPEEVSRFFLFDGELLQEYENLLIEESDQGRKIKEHIESILGVPALIHARDELEVLLKDARAAQRKEAQKSDDLRKFAQDQRILEMKLESVENDLEELKGQRQELQEKMDEIDDFLRNTEAVQQKKIELSKLEAEKDGAEKDIDRLAESNRALLKTVWKDVLANSVHSIVEDLRERRKKCENDLQASIKLQGRIDDLQESITESMECRTCGQKLPEEIRRPLAEKLQTYLEQKTSIHVDTKTLSDLSATIDSLEAIRAEGEVARIIENLNSTTAAKVRLMTSENRWDDIQDEIREFDTDEIMRQREKRERWGTQFARIEVEIAAAEEARRLNVQKQEKLSELMSKHGSQHGSKSNKRVDILQDLETVFSEGIGELRLKMKSNVEQCATESFMTMTTEKTYSGLQINDSYGLSILDPEGKILNERSAGAEQVVALALIDGLNKTSGTRAPIVMDTPLGRLDPKHRQNILGHLPDMAEQVVLLVHEGEIHPKRDTDNFASRIGARYEIKRVSATQSHIEKVT